MQVKEVFIILLPVVNIFHSGSGEERNIFEHSRLIRSVTRTWQPSSVIAICDNPSDGDTRSHLVNEEFSMSVQTSGEFVSRFWDNLSPTTLIIVDDLVRNESLWSHTHIGYWLIK